MSHTNEFGIVGLGKIGGGLSRQALEKGMRVVGFDIADVPSELKAAGIVVAEDLQDLTRKLTRPRIIFLYIPAGPTIDEMLEQLAKVLEKDDIVVDGGNSYWGDSMRRHQRLASLGLHLVDVGTSGGVRGARHGACFMAGGGEFAIKRVEPILRKLAVEDGYVHAGPAGAGHFVKLVHNGIEFGMLQAIGEGMDLMKHSKFDIDLAEVLRCWRHGSVIRGWLVDLMEKIYRERGGFESVEPFIEDTGEVDWLVNDALHFEVAIPVIALAVMQLYTSRDNEQYWARAIAMMRHGFGGHPYGRDPAIAEKRQVGQVGQFPQDDLNSKRNRANEKNAAPCPATLDRDPRSD